MATVYKGILFAVPLMDQTAAKLQKGHIHGVACSMLLDLVLNALALEKKKKTTLFESIF